MNYRDQIINFYSNKKSYYKLEGDNILCIKNKISSCNDNIVLYLKFLEDKLEDISFLGEGCVISISSAEVFCQMLKNKTKDQIKIILDNYYAMWDHQNFDKNTLKDLIIFSELATLNKRRKCANIVYKMIDEHIFNI